MTTIATSRIKWRLRAILSIATVMVALAAGGGNALAITSPESTTVGVVEFLPGSLLIQDAAGNNFTAQLATQSGCTGNNQTIDTIKSWLSLGQAALLSGKTVRIYFNVCGGANYIAGFDLDK